MKEKLFIVGDIHGEYQLLEKLLKHWDQDKEQLIFLGDIADRGPDCKKCLLTVQKLVNEKQAIWISGNHEDILLQWLNEPEENFEWYLRNGGQATMESLIYTGVLAEMSPSEMAATIKSNYPELIEMIQNLPLYYETDYCICVHAGLNFALEDWRETSRRDFLWIRDPFHQGKNTLDKYIIFGHTPVQSLHNHLFDTHFWYADKKICIDGGAVYNGALHGLVISPEGVEASYQMIHPSHRFE